MAYQHGKGYEQLDGAVEIVACADIAEENAAAYAARFDVPRTYTDYREMLENEELDIVSVCTWPHLHDQMVVDAAVSGVQAIHCEKPMADTYGGARNMLEACWENNVQLTFNHMRRFGKPFRRAKRLLDDGEIGQLERLEFGLWNLCDYGAHQFDMCGYFCDQAEPEWIFAQVHYTRERLVFGQPQENEAIALWKYAGGVYGQAITGEGTEVINCHNRIVGSDGVIEVGPAGEDMPVLRVRRWGDGAWESVDCEGETCHGPGYHERAIVHMVECLQEGLTPEICGKNAMQAHTLVFGAYESARSHRRVEFPLQIEDNPLAAMIESGELVPEPRQGT
jgi:predicted dehydrogenase